MKENTILVIGGIVILGFVAYAIYKCHQSSISNHFDDTPSPDISKGRTDVDSSHVADKHFSDFAQTKENAATAIKGTHEEAARIVKESLETIYDNKPKENAKTENRESLEKIGDDLDSLLK